MVAGPDARRLDAATRRSGFGSFHLAWQPDAKQPMPRSVKRRRLLPDAHVGNLVALMGSGRPPLSSGADERTIRAVGRAGTPVLISRLSIGVAGCRADE